MEGFTIVDLAVVVAIVIISAILAYSRGIVREILAIVGWIAAAALAFTFAGAAEPLVREIPYLGDILGEILRACGHRAFALVFALALVVISFFTPLLSSWVRGSALGGLDQGLGFLFGVARGLLLVAVAFIVYDRAVVAEGIPEVDDSRSAAIFARVQSSVETQVPTDAPGLDRRAVRGAGGPLRRMNRPPAR